ncbi:MAG: hypothetical protein EOO23_08580 [Comamonadaceae bacterium]|nr:MAG: hypothetical protein EOO23_08580 [Comamonadaceae bacterium]
MRRRSRPSFQSGIGLCIREGRELPLAPGDYNVTLGERWTVTSFKTGDSVYNGIGPVEVVRSPTLF